MYRYLLAIWFLVLFAFTVKAQKPNTSPTVVKNKKDTLVSTKHDTVVARSFKPKVKKEKLTFPDSNHSPHVALMHSLMVPGWGQLYNHRLWKVPLIYGALGSFGYYIIWNNTNYSEFLALAIYREHGAIPGPKDKYYNEYNLYINVPSQGIYDQKDYFRRNRDLCILGVVGFWGINVIDAYIDAKFMHSYTMDNNLGMKVSPTFLSQPMYAQNPIGSYIPALKITFTLK
jgi:hypothetical protein